METILFGSSNRGKLEEFRGNWGGPVLSPAELATRIASTPPEVDEDGSTYLENARKKVDALFEWSGGVPTVSDDTGLEVEALDGRPGLHSARFAGIGAAPSANIEKLLGLLQTQTRRRAKFVCTLVYRSKERGYLVAEGAVHGEIAPTIRGQGGFGYDSVFIVDGYQGQTLAEIKERGLPVVTHRIAALRNLRSQLGL